MKIKQIIFWWIVAYTVVTLVGIGHTCFNWLVLGMDGNDPALGMYGLESYAKTIPWHVLYNIIIWPVFGIICLPKKSIENPIIEAIKLGGIWVILSIGIDLIGWVAIPHPWRMTFSEFYIDYQPWITLIYLSIFVAPFISLALRRLISENKQQATSNLN